MSVQIYISVHVCICDLVCLYVRYNDSGSKLTVGKPGVKNCSFKDTLPSKGELEWFVFIVILLVHVCVLCTSC